MSPIEGAGLPEEEFSALMGSLSAMAPLLRGMLGGAPSAAPPSLETGAGGAKPPVPKHEGKSREALLLALKPYLSPQKAAAVDTIIRLARVSDVLRTLP